MEEYLSYNGMVAEKDRKLANLLSLITVPTRKSLLEEVENVILPHLPQQLRDLYTSLEKKFQPLKLCKHVHDILTDISQNESLKQYVELIQEITTVRMLKQVGTSHFHLALQHH